MKLFKHPLKRFWVHRDRRTRPNTVRTAGIVSGVIACLAVAASAPGNETVDTSVHATPAKPTVVLAGAPRTEKGRFTNAVGEIKHGTLSVRFPFMIRRIGSSFRKPKDTPDSVPNDGLILRARAETGPPNVTWIGHATLLVQLDGVSFLTDPIWSKRPSPVSFIGPSRFVKPGVALSDLPPIDFVVISHNHYDHLDLPTLKSLAELNPSTIFFVPLGNGDLLRRNGISRVEELDWGQSVSYESLTLHCLPSQHWSKRGLTDNHKALWSSWAVTSSSRRFYFAGDTGYFNGFEQIGAALGPFDLAAVPIGAYAPREMMKSSHMNPEEAIRAAIDVRARQALAIHFGTFNLSDEPLAEPPRRFRAAASEASLLPSSAWVLKIGETRDF
jgi:N-acyl-phosphatidylethanolamine-hydrolysing phospholipase D